MIAKQADNLVCLTCAQQPVIHKNAGQPLAYRLMEQDRCQLSYQRRRKGRK